MAVLRWDPVRWGYKVLAIATWPGTAVPGITPCRILPTTPVGWGFVKPALLFYFFLCLVLLPLPLFHRCWSLIYSVSSLLPEKPRFGNCTYPFCPPRFPISYLCLPQFILPFRGSLFEDALPSCPLLGALSPSDNLCFYLRWCASFIELALFPPVLQPFHCPQSHACTLIGKLLDCKAYFCFFPPLSNALLSKCSILSEWLLMFPNPWENRAVNEYKQLKLLKCFFLD